MRKISFRAKMDNENPLRWGCSIPPPKIHPVRINQKNAREKGAKNPKDFSGSLFYAPDSLSFSFIPVDYFAFSPFVPTEEQKSGRNKKKTLTGANSGANLGGNRGLCNIFFPLDICVQIGWNGTHVIF